MQFKACAQEKDPTKIEAFKSDAVRALSNYMVYQSAQKDTHLQKAMNLDNINANETNQKQDKNSDIDHSWTKNYLWTRRSSYETINGK